MTDLERIYVYIPLTAFCIWLVRFLVKKIAYYANLRARRDGMLHAVYMIRGQVIEDNALPKLYYDMNRASYWSLRYPKLTKWERQWMREEQRQKDREFTVLLKVSDAVLGRLK